MYRDKFSPEEKLLIFKKVIEEKHSINIHGESPDKGYRRIRDDLKRYHDIKVMIRGYYVSVVNWI